MTGEDLSQVESILARAGVDDPAADARAIIDAAMRLADPPHRSMRAMTMAQQRAAGTPLGYIVGSVRFMGIELLAAPGALVPRAETELLGWIAVDALKGVARAGEARLIDMCCGAGNLVCGIAAQLPGVRAWASDLTAEAVQVAQANVQKLGLSERVDVAESDLFAALNGRGLDGTIDVIVCNPPYISTGRLARDRAALLDHEPRAAFDGGPYGVSIFQRVIRDALVFLNPGGTLLFEIGLGQERQVARLFERAGYTDVREYRDGNGNTRVVAGIARS
jgi:release factor glutamine methyltransferase